jgi:hypothetical protein
VSGGTEENHLGPQSLQPLFRAYIWQSHPRLGTTDGLHQRAPLYEVLECTVELRLSGLICKTNHPDKQKIRITGFFFEELRLSGLICTTIHPDKQKIRIIGFFFEELRLSGLICTTIHPDKQKIRINGFFFEELRLSGLICRTIHPDKYKIRIIGFSLKIGYIGSLKRGKKISTNGCFRLHIYLRTNKTLTHNSLHVFDNLGTNLITKRCSNIVVRKCLFEGPSRSG